ncbi:MAG TPA: Crp/Fnr family transcriptional regulator [Rhodobacteraceae bacterium]|nr:Crp/Fnr family transcriptional regulator [Paracoccaceae bacterium]
MEQTGVKDKCKHCALYVDSKLFCAQLAGEDHCDLSNQSRTLSMKRGDTLESEVLAHWPIIAIDSGVLSMQHLLQDGRKTIAALFMRGDIIDLRNISNRNRNRGALIALGKVDVCRLSPKVFERVMAHNPGAQKVIWENLRDQAFRAMDHSGDIAKKQALEKLASFVFECRNRQVGYGEGDLVEIPVRRVDLAEYLGMQPETVSRCFKDLEKRGIIETPSLSALKLLNVPMLRRIANGDKDMLAVESRIKILKIA